MYTEITAPTHFQEATDAVKQSARQQVSTTTILSVSGLSKTYGRHQILKDISFDIKQGECLGILGVNGAGKTTMLETIEGLRKLQKGKVEILGYDLEKNHSSVQSKIGIQLQKNSLFEILSVRDNLRLYMGLYGRATNKTAVTAMLEEFNLIEQESVSVKHLSGGQFQRLKLCLSLLNNPQLLFLDEPTTGLDPSARATLWERIKGLKENGTSIILTTHYMEEAESLCDKVAILHKGRFIVNDTPDALIKSTGFPRAISLQFSQDINQEPEALSSFHCHKKNERELYFYSDNIAKDIPTILHAFEALSISVANINIRQANLEDVFMKLTNSNFEA